MCSLSCAFTLILLIIIGFFQIDLGFINMIVEVFARILCRCIEQQQHTIHKALAYVTKNDIKTCVGEYVHTV
jgi:hypothetical protein